MPHDSWGWKSKVRVLARLLLELRGTGLLQACPLALSVAVSPCLSVWSSVSMSVSVPVSPVYDGTVIVD